MRFLDAFVLVKKGDRWVEATRALEAVRPLLVERPAISLRVELLLGQSYERLGDPDRQYAAFRRALSVEPLSLPAVIGMGQALVAMGKLNDAIQEYRRLVPRVPEAKWMVVRLLVQRNLGLPKNDQDWDEVNNLLKELEPDLKSSPANLTEFYVLKAEATAARGDLAITREFLLKAREETKKIDIWIALANLAVHDPQRGIGEAEMILDEAEKKFGDGVQIRLARSWHWMRRGGKEAPQALVRLTEGIEKFGAAEQRRLLLGCAKGCALLGDLGRSEQLWQRLEKQQPQDLTTRMALFDIALETSNNQALDTLIADMRRIEGASGTRWRYARAKRLTWLALKGNDREGLEEASSLLKKLALERPNWHQVAVTRGQVYELQGKRETAVAQYMEAVELGERNPAIINRLCLLLYQSQRYADAAKVMQKLPEGAILSQDVRQIAVDLSLRSQDYAQARVLAKKAVDENPKDYRSRLWLAQTYLALKMNAKAEYELREAIELASDVPETWVVLVECLVFAGKKDKAEFEIKKIAEAKTKLSSKDVPLLLAQCYLAIGDRDKARKHYQQALKNQPDHLPTLQGAADFYLRVDELPEAEKCLRQIIALKNTNPEKALSAQRVLAAILALSGKNYEKSRESLAQLGVLAAPGNSVKPGDETIDQLRNKAMTLALLKHRTDRQAAIAILVQMRERQPLTADDQFLLAQLYDSVGAWDKAYVEFSALVNKDGKNFSYLTRLAMGLLRHGQLDGVPPLLAKLENEKLYASSAATAEIKARLWHAQKETKNAVQLLRKYAEENQDKWRFVVGLLEELKELDAAEDLLRKNVARSKEADSGLALAQYLGRHGRLDEALDICKKAAPDCRAEMIAASCLTILYSGKPKNEHFSRVKKLLDAGLQKERTVILLDFLGAYHNLREEFPEAETAFRDALALNADDPTALNNLSWLLAFQPQKNAEALQLVQRAIKTRGPGAGLLDTRGVIHLKAGRADEAVRDLEDAVAEAPTASHYFHLAQAYLMANKRDRAEAALKEADRIGMQVNPLESRADQQLRAQLNMARK